MLDCLSRARGVGMSARADGGKREGEMDWEPSSKLAGETERRSKIVDQATDEKDD